MTAAFTQAWCSAVPRTASAAPNWHHATERWSQRATSSPSASSLIMLYQAIRDSRWSTRALCQRRQGRVSGEMECVWRGSDEMECVWRDSDEMGVCGAGRDSGEMAVCGAGQWRDGVICVTYKVWTWEQKISTLCRNLKHCMDLHTSTHEFENLNFLKKEAFCYVVICLKIEENIKRKTEDDRPKKNLQ